LSFTTDVLLKDGESLRLRSVSPSDRDPLARQFPPGLEDHDFEQDVGFVATRGSKDEEIVGFGRFHRLEAGGDAVPRAEFALSVADAWRQRGVGTALLEQMTNAASRLGIERFEADMLPGGPVMMDLLAHLGFDVGRETRDGVIRPWFPVRLTEASRRAIDERNSRAAARSIRALFEPRSVALLGASRKLLSISGALLRNLRESFKGEIYPINPAGGEIQGLPAFTSVAAIGKTIDVGIIAVPAAGVYEAVRECAEAGANAVVVISAGFAEMGKEGQAEQERLRDFVRRSGMRMVGPNCMGILNTDPRVGLNATFAPTAAPPGNVGMLSQSGSLGVAILEHARDLHIGISSFVSVGNKADVSGNDLLAFWKDDPRTGVIALYLESFGNPRRFARLAPEVARKKPIVAVKAGRSAAGTRAASSHSASLACLDVGIDALFEQAGVIRTATLEEMFDVAALLSTQPPPAGPRVGVVTNAGGPGILLADACEAQGLVLPELEEASLEDLRSFLPRAAGFKNPIDMIASATPEQYERAIGIVGRDPKVDAVIVVFVPPLVTTAGEIAAAVARGASAVPAHKPVLTVFLASQGAPAMLPEGGRSRLPSYAFPENAARALGAAFKYQRWRERPAGSIVRLTNEQRALARKIVQQSFDARRERHWLEIDDVRALLEVVGITMAETRIVACADAASTARILGFPVVAKAVAPGLVHKTDAGGVALNLRSEVEVSAAVATMGEKLARAGFALERVILQKQIERGLEALVGVVVDPTFGPLLVCGIGGVQVELLRDVSFHLPPVSDLDAADMIDRLRLRPLFDGYRGSPPADRDALIALLQRLSALVLEMPEIRELDLNPVMVMRPGEGAVVVDARILVGPGTDS
jgi:acetyl coenzyme A synthetase (ADP forming)-like protein